MEYPQTGYRPQVLVDRSKLVALKGDLGRASAEVVRPNAYVMLFNKSHDSVGKMQEAGKNGIDMEASTYRGGR